MRECFRLVLLHNSRIGSVYGKRIPGLNVKKGLIIMENINEAIDIVIFAGQSNMSGRGNAAEATICDTNAGFEYKAVSNPTMLVPITEPFGLNEDKAGAIDDRDSKGRTKRRGSMVSAVVNEYYKRTKRQVAAVSASVGGTSTEKWKSNYINDAVARLDSAKAFLEENNILINHIFAVWCQGESDGDAGVSAQIYTENTLELFDRLKKHGAEKCFLIQIGHFNYIDYPDGSSGITAEERDRRYSEIRNAQAELCGNNEDFILAGSFEGHLKNMADEYHYNQAAYNEVGRAVGRVMADYIKNSDRTAQ